MKKKNLTAIILIVLGVLFIIFKLDLIKYLISSFGLLFIIFGIINTNYIFVSFTITINTIFIII